MARSDWVQEGAEAWAIAQKGVATIDAVVLGWQSLGDLTMMTTTNRRYAVLRQADVEPGRRSDDLEAGKKRDAWGAVIAEHRLRLPSFGEYRRRVAAVQASKREVATVVDRGRSHVAGREVRVPAV